VGLTLQFLESATLTASTPSPATVVVNTGLPGPQGPAGDSATIAVGTVTALPYGSAPTVNNVGTSSAAIFDFGVVAGPQGLVGPAGATGPQGPAGVGVSAGGIAGQVLAKINGTDYNTHWVDLPSLTGYATESWVLARGYITSSALSPYLTSAAAASTYLTITNAASTYATNAALSSYLTVAAASSTYAPIAAKVPTGGSTGQVLAKSSSSDYATTWQTPAVGDKYYSLSTTTLALSNGAKTLTIATGLSYTTQQDIIIANDATHHMHAVVTSYNPSTGVLVADVQQHTGTGTFSSWTVNVGGISSVAEWGLITGTLSNQTDLNSALNSRPTFYEVQLGWVAKTGTDTVTVLDAYDNKVTMSGATGFIAQNNSATSTTQLTYSGITFPDSTVQTTAAVPGLPDAPSDGTPYVRQDGAWVQLIIS
jgi:hypothetical protein